jgi:hypothetical protein
MAEMRRQLLDDVERLRTLAATAGDPRLSALLIAVSDSSTQDLLAGRVDEGRQYVGARISISGSRAHVVFVFERPAGEFGILPLSILVTVDLNERRLIQVVDNYLPRSDLGALQPGLDLRSFLAERAPDEAAETPEAQTDGGTQNAPPPKGSTWV